MNPALRLSALSAALIACLMLSSPAHSGDFFAETACDSSASDETTYTLMIIDLSGSDICKVELRPEAVGSLPAAPITSWEMPPGWTAEPIKGEPGAIIIRGCVQAYHLMDGFKITMPGRAGKIHGTGYDSTGTFYHDVDHVFFCGADPTPAAAATWGQLKSLYR